MLTPYLTLASVVSLFSFFFSYMFVYLFAGVPWHLCIKDSSASSTLSLIQLPEHLGGVREERFKGLVYHKELALDMREWKLAIHVLEP
jgi:hypothetical protein